MSLAIQLPARENRMEFNLHFARESPLPILI